MQVNEHISQAENQELSNNFSQPLDVSYYVQQVLGYNTMDTAWALAVTYAHVQQVAAEVVM